MNLVEIMVPKLKAAWCAYKLVLRDALVWNIRLQGGVSACRAVDIASKGVWKTWEVVPLLQFVQMVDAFLGWYPIRVLNRG